MVEKNGAKQCNKLLLQNETELYFNLINLLCGLCKTNIRNALMNVKLLKKLLTKQLKSCTFKTNRNKF